MSRWGGPASCKCTCVVQEGECLSRTADRCLGPTPQPITSSDHLQTDEMTSTSPSGTAAALAACRAASPLVQCITNVRL